MSATGLDVFDKTIQTTNIWLDEIMDRLGPDRQMAWKVLSTVLHKLRDALPVDLAAHLSAQLPLLVRGAYYDLYRPSSQPAQFRTAEAFLEDLSSWLQDTRPVNTKDALAAVVQVLRRHIAAGEIAKIRRSLPKAVRSLWNEASADRE
jgi:uncharacterized protein (DUF2267 family)